MPLYYRPMRVRCVLCKEPFGEANVFTQAGWRETQITGLCEACFDRVTAEDDEETIDDTEQARAPDDRH